MRAIPMPGYDTSGRYVTPRPHGGRRPGAGRKPTGKMPLIPVGVTLSARHLSLIGLHGSQAGLSQSAALRAILDQFIAAVAEHQPRFPEVLDEAVAGVVEAFLAGVKPPPVGDSPFPDPPPVG
jgi:hypothetical protein